MSVAADLLYATGLTGEDVEDLLPDLPEPVSRRSGRRATDHHVALRRDTSQDVLRPEP